MADYTSEIFDTGVEIGFIIGEADGVSSERLSPIYNVEVHNYYLMRGNKTSDGTKVYWISIDNADFTGSGAGVSVVGASIALIDSWAG